MMIYDVLIDREFMNAPMSTSYRILQVQATFYIEIEYDRIYRYLSYSIV